MEKCGLHLGSLMRDRVTIPCLVLTTLVGVIGLARRPYLARHHTPRRPEAANNSSGFSTPPAGDSGSWSTGHAPRAGTPTPAARATKPAHQNTYSAPTVTPGPDTESPDNIDETEGPIRLRIEQETETAGLDLDLRNTRNRERAMHRRAESLRVSMSVDEVLAIVAPACCHTNPVLRPEFWSEPDRPRDLEALQKSFLPGKTPSVLSPHPKRASHLIGDTFNVLAVFWNDDAKLANWYWEHPPRD